MLNRNLEHPTERDALAMACICLMMKTNHLADAIKMYPDGAEVLFSKSTFYVKINNSPGSHTVTFVDISKEYYTNFDIESNLELNFKISRDALIFAFDKADVLFFEPMDRRHALMSDQAARFELSEAEFRFLVSNSRFLKGMVAV